MVGRSGVRRRLKILFPALLILCSANFILFHRSTGYVSYFGALSEGREGIQKCFQTDTFKILRSHLPA